MNKAIADDKVDELIKSIEDDAKNSRSFLHDIVLYTEGAYNIKDLWAMPIYFIKEILERIEKKDEKIKMELEKAKGKQVTRF